MKPRERIIRILIKLIRNPYTFTRRELADEFNGGKIGAIDGDIEELKNGVSASLENKYKNFLRNFDFMGAELLKVQIRKNMFGRWMSEGELEKDIFILPHPKHDGSPIEVNYYVLKKKYNSELGLRKNEDDTRLFGEETINT